MKNQKWNVTLGVSETATDEEVKRVYHELARKYHPDNYPDNLEAHRKAELKMQEINAAYEAYKSQKARLEQSQSYSQEWQSEQSQSYSRESQSEQSSSQSHEKKATDSRKYYRRSSWLLWVFCVIFGGILTSLALAKVLKESPILITFLGYFCGRFIYSMTKELYRTSEIGWPLLLFSLLLVPLGTWIIYILVLITVWMPYLFIASSKGKDLGSILKWLIFGSESFE